MDEHTNARIISKCVSVNFVMVASVPGHLVQQPFGFTSATLII